MLTALLGRFFQYCIKAAEQHRQAVRVSQYDPRFMTNLEISDFLHGRLSKINWDRIDLRRKLGQRMDNPVVDLMAEGQAS